MSQVDEVDDLVVNEEPTLPYVKKDRELSESFAPAFKALEKDLLLRPPGVGRDIWREAQNIKRIAETKKRQTNGDVGHYKDTGSELVMLDIEGRQPKVKGVSDWISWLNFKKDPIQYEPTKYSYFNVLCTPHLFSQYGCIFGLTGYDLPHAPARPDHFVASLNPTQCASGYQAFPGHCLMPGCWYTLQYHVVPLPLSPPASAAAATATAFTALAAAAAAVRAAAHSAV